MVNMEMVERVLDFIEETKTLFEMEPIHTEHGVSAVEYFTRGGCGEFYRILKSEFPQAIMMATFSFNHIVTDIDGVLYDVRGVFDQLYNIVEITPEQEKVFCNYAFTTQLSDTFLFGPTDGPTAAMFLYSIEHDLTEEERKRFFDDCRDIEPYYEDKYCDYKRALEGKMDSLKYHLMYEELGIPVLNF